MKKLLLTLLFSFSITNFNNIEIDKTNNLANNIDIVSINEIEKKDKRNYNYVFYTNNDNYYISNIDDIKNSIYNGLNNGKDTIILYCKYNNNDDCLNDFYTVYNNKLLMSSINDYVSPYNKYSSTSYRININNGNVKISLDIDKKYTDEQIKEIDEKLDNYLNELNIDTMSDIDKIKWAHDFLIDKNKYDLNAAEYHTGGNSFNAYGAIVENQAVCQGYAEAMSIILDRFNIPNIMISNRNHIWNLVNIDSKWLHLDATWDDPVYENGKNDKIYDYYLITTEKLNNLDNSSSHQFDSNYYLESLIN